jgi:hypothetical protein
VTTTRALGERTTCTRGVDTPQSPARQRFNTKLIVVNASHTDTDTLSNTDPPTAETRPDTHMHTQTHTVTHTRKYIETHTHAHTRKHIET